MLSVSQAAEQLGISSSRVRALIKAGSLSASKCGKAWTIKEEEVLNRISNKPKAGRPSNSFRYTQYQPQDNVENNDVKKAQQIYDACRELFRTCPSNDLILQARSHDEASFYMAVSDFFLQEKQAELITRGVF